MTKTHSDLSGYMGLNHTSLERDETHAALAEMVAAREASHKRPKDPRLRARFERLRNAIVTSNLRLVASIATKYRGRGLDVVDLMAEGSIGLMRALERFDLDRGRTLSTYASHWIAQYMRRAISNTAETLRVPVHLQDARYACNQASWRFEAVNGRAPTDAEVAKATKLRPAWVERARRATGKTKSLDAPIADECGDLHEVLPHDAPSPEEACLSEERASVVHMAVAKLPERLKRVMVRRYDDHERTLDEVGQELLVCRERVRQVESEAITAIRQKHFEALEGLR